MSGMTSVMTFIWFVNSVLESLFGLLFRPFGSADPFWALVFVSFLTGIFMIWVFGKTSNQEGLRSVKDRIWGNLLGVRLYQHDAAVILKLQARILRDTVRYMGFSLAPMLVLMLPLLLILVQLNLYFSVRPLRPGEAALVTVEFNDPSGLAELVALRSPEGAVVETPPVRLGPEGEASWRIRARRAGVHRLEVQVGEETIQKMLHVGEAWGAIPLLRTRSPADLLLYPGEPPIDSSSHVRSVEVGYPSLLFWDWKVHWLVPFFILSIAFAFAFKGFFGVDF